MNSIIQTTLEYEDFIRKCITLLDDDLALKHIRIREDPFIFFRGTYYRWVELFASELPKLVDAPKITAVGDLHVENFGTFRSPDGELEWGVNDFDEVDVMPYTNDIVRLAASALFAIKENKLAITQEKACKAILEGYKKRLDKGTRKTFILRKRKEPFLTKLVKKSFDDEESFWRHLRNSPYIDFKSLPSAALDLLNIYNKNGKEWFVADEDYGIESTIKLSGGELVLHRRIAGMGSLGHRRIVAIIKKKRNNNNNGNIPIQKTIKKNRQRYDRYMAYELKELGPPATFWLNNNSANKAIEEDGWDKESLLQMLQASTSLSNDPSRQIKENWQIRRIAPDCVRLELSMLPDKLNEDLLLERMGDETANIHIAAKEEEGQKHVEVAHAILSDLDKRPRDWLVNACNTMMKSVNNDYLTFKEKKIKK